LNERAKTSAVIAVILDVESTVQVASLPAAAAAAAAAAPVDVDMARTTARPRGRTVNYSPARRMPVTSAGSAAADRQRLRASLGRESDDHGGGRHD